MKTLIKIAIAIVLLMNVIKVTGQIQFGEKESFAFSVYVDPSASLKDNGLDIGADIEYKGFMFAKIGLESFADLPGGYFDIHAAFGPRFTIGRNENLAIYTGFRGGVVRRNGAVNPIAGFEGGIDYVFRGGLTIGLNGSYIYRGDQQAFQLPAIWRENFYIKIGYSWENRRR